MHRYLGPFLVTVAAVGMMPPAAPAPAQAPAVAEDQLMLEGAGIDATLLAEFIDGAPIDAVERPSLITVFSGLRQCAQADFDRLARKPAAGAELTAATARGKLWQLRGTLKSVTAEDLTAEEVERVYAEVEDMPAADARRRAYVCVIELDDGGPTVTVHTLRFPRELTDAAKPGERMGVQGVVVKNAGSADAPHSVLAARTVAWYPRTPLGDLGMNYTLYDDVRREAHDLKQERECFYQLLATMQKVDFAQLLKLAGTDRPHSVVPLFNAPETVRGQLLMLEGQARRAVAVVVDDPDIVERFGIRRYYEVAIYTPDSQNNPLLFNLLELPPGFTEGDNIREPVRVVGTLLTGFYYRRDPLPYEKDQGIKPSLQKAPLLLGRTLERNPRPDRSESTGAWLYAAAILSALAVLTFAVWRATRAENKTRDLLMKQQAPPPGTSLNDAPVEYRAKPDFAGLDVAPPNEDAP